MSDNKKKIDFYQEGFKELTPDMIKKIEEEEKKNKEKLKKLLDKEK